MGFELTNLVVIGTDCTCSCKSKYHTITTTTVPAFVGNLSWIVMGTFWKNHLFDQIRRCWRYLSIVYLLIKDILIECKHMKEVKSLKPWWRFIWFGQILKFDAFFIWVPFHIAFMRKFKKKEINYSLSLKTK